MDWLIDTVKNPFFLGLGLGLLFFVWSAWSHLKTKSELRRYRKHLSDKLELEARQYELMRKEKEALAKENENLRLRVGQISEKPDQKVMRDLEILARAEKRMMMQAPGFAPAWEAAKAAAADEVINEDQGRSLPRRLFNRLFGTGTAHRDDTTRLIQDATPQPQNAEPVRTEETPATPAPAPSAAAASPSDGTAAVPLAAQAGTTGNPAPQP